MSNTKRYISSEPRDLRFIVALMITFLALVIVNVSHHAMWRDETRAWQIAQASQSLAALHANLRYEGSPMLWYVIVWAITKLASSLPAIQVVHAVIATTVVLVFARCAPFSKATKVLFAFGYFPFFEYAAITRHYSLLLLLFLLCTAVLTRPRPRPFLLAGLLALLSQVSLWGAGFAGLLVPVTIAIWWRRIPAWKCGVLTGIVLISCAVCYIEIHPPPGDSLLNRWRDQSTTVKVMGSIGTIWDGWIPLPSLQRNFWNKNIAGDKVLTFFSLSCLMLLVATMSLLKRPIALGFFILGMSGLLLFTYFRFIGSARHHGQLFMVLIVAAWIAACSPPSEMISSRVPRISNWLDQHRERLLIGLLAIHAIGGIGANAISLVFPFSAGKEIAEYIRREVPPDVTLVGVDDFCMSPIAAYSGRTFYFPQMGRFAPFNTQNDNERIHITKELLLNDIAQIIDQTNHDVVLFLSSGFTLGADESDFTVGDEVFHASLVRRFMDSTVEDEAELMYRIQRRSAASSRPG